jgi:hypothetical protein
MMRKAIGLTVKLWITGEDEPANNYFNLTSQFVRDLIAESNARSANLRIAVKAIAEVRDYDDEMSELGASAADEPLPMDLEPSSADDI